MDNNKDLLLLLGMILTQLDGEITITAETQLKFSENMVNKQLLIKEDETNTVTIKLAEMKEEVKDSCLDCGMEIKENDTHYCEVVQPTEETEED